MTLDAILSVLLTASLGLNAGLVLRAKNMADLRREFGEKFGEITAKLVAMQMALGDTEDHGLRGRVEEIASRAHRAEAIAKDAATKAETVANRVTQLERKR